MRIFCLPHAGGGAHHYLGWQAYFDSNIEWVPLDYAGHFSRIGEAAYQTFEHAAQDLAAEMIRQAQGKPFAVVGHSMGGALAYEIAHLLERQQLADKVLFVVISSALPPHLRDTKMPRYYEFSDQEFIQHLVDTGGISQQLAEQPTLMASFLPLIRDDYRLFHQYQPQAREPLTIPLHTIRGEQELHNEKMAAWKNYSHAFVGGKTYPGGHFYWHHCLDRVAADLSKIIELKKQPLIIN